MNDAAETGSLFTIRKATVADSEGILKCLHSAFEPFKTSYTSGAYSDTVLDPATLHQRLQEMNIFVAVSETQIVGTISCQMVNGEEGHLRGMAVLPSWQGRGIAQQLLERAQSELRGADCKRITLDTTEPLKRAVRFYERNGFIKTGRVTDFFGMPLFEYEKRP
jgi:ribosomal protein S18 acetylase RimI-like enzyme